jgi:HD superfamily phosphohydrolase YqeK
MQNYEFFKREISNIANEQYRHFVEWYFQTKVGAWFWESGASASGKYHPTFTKGVGGLVKHTRAAEMFLEELLHLNTYAYMMDEYKDFARIAILLHDTCKYGTADTENHDCYRTHGRLAADNVAAAWEEYFNTPCSAFLHHAIASHMGQWVEDKEDKPFTNLDRLVHLADYIASRSFLDIPSLSAEYAEDAGTALDSLVE